jgi:hypothetical protein
MVPPESQCALAVEILANPRVRIVDDLLQGPADHLVVDYHADTI